MVGGEYPQDLSHISWYLAGALFLQLSHRFPYVVVGDFCHHRDLLHRAIFTRRIVELLMRMGHNEVSYS